MQFTISLPFLFLALITGTLFGFLLRKATVSRFDVIVSQLLLKDFTVMKVIMTAIMTGSLGIYFFDALGLIPTFHLAKTPVLWTALGGGVFGIGMALTGYCPGTCIAALGEGSKDVLFGIVGMLLGSILFQTIYPYLKPAIEEQDACFQHTFASYFQLPNWLVVLFLAMVWTLFVVGMRMFDRRINRMKINLSEN